MPRLPQRPLHTRHTYWKRRVLATPSIPAQAPAASDPREVHNTPVEAAVGGDRAVPAASAVLFEEALPATMPPDDAGVPEEVDTQQQSDDDYSGEPAGK